MKLTGNISYFNALFLFSNIITARSRKQFTNYTKQRYLHRDFARWIFWFKEKLNYANAVNRTIVFPMDQANWKHRADFGFAYN